MRVAVEAVEKEEGGWMARVWCSEFTVLQVVGEGMSLDEALDEAVRHAIIEIDKTQVLKSVQRGHVVGAAAKVVRFKHRGGK
jgi:flavin-binding protein dodecin